MINDRGNGKIRNMRKMLLFGLVAAGLLLAVWFTQMPARASASAEVSVGLEKTWGGADYEFARGVAVDQDGNIYVVGDTDSFGVGIEAFILKYNAAGSLMWQKTWGGADDDYAFSVAVDQDGNIYVVGVTYSFGPNNDAFILKYNAAGSLMWQKTWGGDDWDAAFSVAVDGANIYVAGGTYSFGLSSDAFILKYNAAGSLMWQKTWGGAGSESSYGVASGSVYVTGYTHSSPPRTLNDVSGTETTPSGTETTPSGTLITPSGTVTTPSGTETTPSGEPSQGGTDAFLISLLVHDVAVVDVTLSKTVVGQGYCTSINVTVENQGAFIEAFNVTAYYGSYGNATLTPQQWETFWSMGDVNRDGYINEIDENLIMAAMFSEPGDYNWCSWADLNQDDNVGIPDLMIHGLNDGLDIWTYFINGGVIGTQGVWNLPAGNQLTLTFTWNTAGIAYGNYNISAYAVPILCEEVDRADNNYEDGIVMVTIPGDVNGDRIVDIFDIVYISVGYNANTDINCDGKVNIDDIDIASAHWGETW